MEGNIPSLLLTHLVFFILPAPPTSGLTISKVVHVSNSRSWWEARDYCRTRHSDLVTITNTQEANKLASYDGWIGLRQGPGGVWKWSIGDEIARFFLGDFGEQG